VNNYQITAEIIESTFDREFAESEEEAFDIANVLEEKWRTDARVNIIIKQYNADSECYESSPLQSIEPTTGELK
jgi:hypothetical protein